MYACMSVTLLQIDSSPLFLDGIEPFFVRHLSMWHSIKRSSIFDLGPLTPKIYSPKLLAIMLHYHPWSRTRQFSSCLEKVGNPLNFGADPCCHGNEIWPRRGDQDAYRLVTMSAAAWCRVATLQSSSEFPDFSRCFYRMR